MHGSPVPPGPDASAFTRRSFLKGASLAAVGGVAATADGAAPPATNLRRAGGATIYGAGRHELALTINGQERKVSVETRTTLLDALRDSLDLTGTKRVCDRGACGACTVSLDGEPVNACLVLAFDAVGKPIETIEGVTPADAGELHPVQRAFVEHDALQCGFCTPGFVMASIACLERHGSPTREQIRHDLSGNLCRCGTYGRIFDAVEHCGRAARSPR